MKDCYLILIVVGLFFCSCQKDDLSADKTDVIENEEYFTFEIDGTTFSVEDPDHIAGTVYPSSDTGVINFDFFGELTPEYSVNDIYRGLIFKVCFYEGPGTYFTGTDQTVSWAYIWIDSELWENHYNYGNDPGVVIIKNATNNFVEGTFEYEGYNPNLETTILVEGNFGLKLESLYDFRNM